VGFLSLCRFHAARWFANNPTSLLVFSLSITVSLVVLTLVVVSREQLQSLAQERTRLRLRPIATNVTGPAVDMKLELPGFAPGMLVKSFNSIASDMQVPVEEVAYVLDRSTTTPYLRYHVTLSTKAGYANIRKFIAVLSSELPNVALDSIRCSRQDAVAPTLDCELAFSAFFAKEVSHG
jgi:hypothetical protein